MVKLVILCALKSDITVSALSFIVTILNVMTEREPILCIILAVIIS